MNRNNKIEIVKGKFFATDKFQVTMPKAKDTRMKHYFKYITVLSSNELKSTNAIV